MCIVELGVERPAVLVDDGPGIAEPLPELLRDALRQARTVLLLGLPGLEQLVELGGDLLPLHLAQVAGGDGLGTLDEGGALGDGLLDELLRLLCLLGRGLGQRRGQRGETIAETGEVADGRGVRGFVDEVRGLLRQVARGGAAGLVALLQGDDLEGDVVVLADEVGQSLIGGPVRVLTDDAPGLAFADLDGAVFGDAAPVAGGRDRGRLRRGRRDGGRCRRLPRHRHSGRGGNGRGRLRGLVGRHDDSPCAVTPREAERTRLSLVRPL